MGIIVKNIYKDSSVSDNEIFEGIIQNDKFQLERIISKGQATPAGEWLSQDKDEWVILLSGSAGILFEGETEPLILNPGDYLLIQANTKHRVEWTNDKTETVWLALHF